MENVTTHPTLKITEKEYEAFHTVENVLYELAGEEYADDIYKLFDGRYERLGSHIDDFWDFAYDFISFIDKYGKVVKEN